MSERANEEARGEDRVLAASPAQDGKGRGLALLARGLAALGPMLERLRNLLISAAVVAILVVALWAIVTETRRQAILVERIEVPKDLEERGLRGEVLANRLLDAIARTTAAAHWRGERPTVAAGWKTAEFQVPALGLSLDGLVRLLENLWGRPDRRISGELVRTVGALTLRLRVTPPRDEIPPVAVAVDDPTAGETALERALARS